MLCYVTVDRVIVFKPLSPDHEQSCSMACGGSSPLALNHSQFDDKNIHEQEEKVIPNVVCRNMCQRHQNRFAEYPSARGSRRRYMQRLVRIVSWHSKTFQFIVTQRCIFPLLLLKFTAYTPKCNRPVKMSSKKMSVYGLRGITHFGAKLLEFQRSCKGHVIYTVWVQVNKTFTSRCCLSKKIIDRKNIFIRCKSCTEVFVQFVIASIYIDCRFWSVALRDLSYRPAVRNHT